MSTLASLLVKLGIDAGDFHKGVAAVEGSSGKLLGTLGKLAAPVAIGAGALAVGKMAFQAGQDFDGATDTIVTKTGATGAALAGLQDDFKAVFTSIPTDAATAADAISDMAARTGASGQVLQDLTKPLLEATRLLGGDATTNAGLFARVMGDWGIPVEKGASTLDKLFVTSQKTGVGMDSLMGKVVQFGSPLRLMGFSLEDSMALFGKWEKEGVNSELVMGSLRIAAGKFAKSGKPLRESLLGTFDAIQKNKNATEALALGMDTFGARAGPDMVAAIREGRFSIDDLVASMGTADGAIMKTAATTADFPEKLAVIKSKLMSAMAPAGLTIMDTISTALDKAMPLIERLLPYLPQIATAVLGIGAAFVAANVVTTIGGVVTAISALGPALALLSGPVGWVIAIVALLAAAWATDFGGIREKTAAVWEKLRPIFEAVRTWLGVHLPPVLQALAGFWQNTLLPAITAVWQFISTKVIPLLQGIVNVEIAAVKLALKALAGLWENVLLPALKAVWKFISENVAPIFMALVDVVQKNLGPVLTWLKDNVLGPVAKAFDGIGSAIDSVIGWLGRMAEKINKIKLPSWLTPGSPTPFELGLRGIASALALVAGTDVPLFGARGPQLAFAGAGVGSAHGLGQRNGAERVTNNYAFNVTVNAQGAEPRAVERATRAGVLSAARALGVR